jgi:hypothetical protein
MYDKRKTMMSNTQTKNRRTHPTWTVDTITCVRTHYGGHDIVPQ